MRRRLYFLLPDIKLTRQVFNELLLARIQAQPQTVNFIAFL